MTADDFGEFDEFTVVPNVGQTSDKVQIVHTAIYNLTGPGNATTILVPNSGISIVSDIDDVLRVTKVYVPNQGLFNSFVEPYVNEMGVPELFAHWNKTLPGVAFHYDTTTPVQLTRTYVDYLFANYPLGSLEMRPINLTEPSQVLDARQNSLLKLFQTFPQRKFGKHFSSSFPWHCIYL
jgi:phosphatidate phosphatase APP1